MIDSSDIAVLAAGVAASGKPRGRLLLNSASIERPEVLDEARNAMHFLDSLATGPLYDVLEDLEDAFAAIGIVIPEPYGGLGLGVFEYCLITEELARAWMSVASIIARGNGGANAGHTVFTPDGKKLVSHLIPCGLAQNKICVIGRGEFFNAELFLKELDYDKKSTVSPEKILKHIPAYLHYLFCFSLK